MTLDPPRRSFSEKTGKTGPKDVDAADRAQKFKALGFALYGGIPLGAAGGYLLGHVFLGVVLGPVLIYSVVVGIATVSGRGASALYMPSGSTTPKPKEYSRAKALEIRGQYEEAIRAYEVEILEAPQIAEPYLKIARLYRDELKDTDAAIRWFGRAQSEARLTSGESIRTHREVAEIFLYLMREPRRAAPALARLAEGYPFTPDGEWAARELAQIKAEMSADLREADPDS